jgi:hypothetical protein
VETRGEALRSDAVALGVALELGGVGCPAGDTMGVDDGTALGAPVGSGVGGFDVQPSTRTHEIATTRRFIGRNGTSSNAVIRPLMAVKHPSNRTIIDALSLAEFMLGSAKPAPLRHETLPKQVRYHWATPRREQRFYGDAGGAGDCPTGSSLPKSETASTEPSASSNTNQPSLYWYVW